MRAHLVFLSQMSFKRTILVWWMRLPLIDLCSLQARSHNNIILFLWMPPNKRYLWMVAIYVCFFLNYDLSNMIACFDGFVNTKGFSISKPNSKKQQQQTPSLWSFNWTNGNSNRSFLVISNKRNQLWNVIKNHKLLFLTVMMCNVCLCWKNVRFRKKRKIKRKNGNTSSKKKKITNLWNEVRRTRHKQKAK